MEPKQRTADYKVLPEAHSDFVFSVSSEWLPTIAVIAVAVAVVLACRWIRTRYRS